MELRRGAGTGESRWNRQPSVDVDDGEEAQLRLDDGERGGVSGAGDEDRYGLVRSVACTVGVRNPSRLALVVDAAGDTDRSVRAPPCPSLPTTLLPVCKTTRALAGMLTHKQN